MGRELSRQLLVPVDWQGPEAQRGLGMVRQCVEHVAMHEITPVRRPICDFPPCQYCSTTVGVRATEVGPAGAEGVPARPREAA